jgi:DNA-binding XRE family transcriptional regulator
METGGYARLTPEIAEAIARAVKMPVALLFSDCPVKPSVPATPLREVLSNEGKSRRQFAREIGIGEAHLSSIILGSRVPDAYLAARIAAIVGVPVHHLFPHIRQGAA